MLPIEFQVGSGEEVKKQIFKMAALKAILDFGSEQFKLFLISMSLKCFLPSFKSTGLLVQEKK